jgi:hypothetical protein
MGIMAILKDYPREVIEYVTHPDTGMHRLKGREDDEKISKFLPYPEEVERACMAAKRTIDAEIKMKSMGWTWNGDCWEKTNAA